MQTNLENEKAAVVAWGEGKEWKRQSDRKGNKQTFEGDECGYACVKTYAVQLKYVQFIVCQFYLKNLFSLKK